MMNKVRWGLLSTARINAKLIPPIRASERGELVAVASRSQATAEAYAQEWGMPLSFGSYEEMLSSDSIDAVYIGLPNHLHAEWSIRALELGKHVLCEKPFALSLDEVDAMIAASQKHERILAEAFMYRHHPQTKLAGEWVHSGKLGDLLAVRGSFTFSLQDDGDVRMIPEYGGGCLWDVGVYPLSLAQFIFQGPPVSVAGEQRIDRSHVDVAFAGQMSYEGDRKAQIFSSFRTPFYTYAEIIGTGGRLELKRPFVQMDTGQHMFFYPPEGEPVTIPVPQVELYSGEIEDMHSAILDKTPQYLTLEETRNHVKTVLALYESASQHRIVDL